MLQLLAAALLLVSTSSLADQTRTETLDALLEAGSFDQLFFRLTPERFSQAPLSTETAKQDLIWLNAKAEAGHVPLTYVYAYRLLADNPEDAVLWYAKGRIWTFLDASECASPARTPWQLILEATFGDGFLNSARNTYPLVYLRSANDALRNDETRQPRPSAKWYCDNGQNENLLIPDAAATERKKRIAKMLEDNQRKLNAGRDE